MPGQWIELNDLCDTERIWPGTVVRVYGVGLAVSRQEDDFFDYLMCEIYSNGSYLQLSCLSQGEGGNILCVVAREPDMAYSSGRELKRMLSGPQRVLINRDPFCTVH